MIPLQIQAALRQRFLNDMTSRVRIDLFTQKKTSLFVSGRDECVFCEETGALLEELDMLSEKITLTTHDFEAERALAAELGVDKVPAIVIRGQSNRVVRYFGLPAGVEFAAFIETIVDSSRGTPVLQPATLRSLRKIKDDVRLDIMVTPVDPHSPPVARMAAKMALLNGRIRTSIVEIGEYPALAQRYGIRFTPTAIINEKLGIPGLIDEATLLQGITNVLSGKLILGSREVGAGTPFSLPQQGQQQPAPRTVGSSGLILP